MCDTQAKSCANRGKQSFKVYHTCVQHTKKIWLDSCAIWRGVSLVCLLSFMCSQTNPIPIMPTKEYYSERSNKLETTMARSRKSKDSNGALDHVDGVYQ